MKYRVIFTGRKSGAIGIAGFVVLDLDAESPEHALMRCYETHDHIHDPRVIDLATNKPVGLPGPMLPKEKP